jgi:acetyltransferase-like isoleucine patch superfamily enzyme
MEGINHYPGGCLSFKKADIHFVELGKECIIQDSVILGLRYKKQCKKVKMGDSALIRAFTIVYADVVIGNDFKSGHFVTIRENTKIGDKVIIGSGVVIDGNVLIGNRVKIETNAYVPIETKIGSDVFIGPGVIMTNDKYPQRIRGEYLPLGPVIEDGVSIGANSTILPGLKIETGSFIAAGSIVTKNIPPWSMVKGPSGKIMPLPKKLRERNTAKKW